MFPKKSNQFKNILVLGLGGVGYYLAKRLTHDGHAVTAIESDKNRIRRADGDFDARLIHGDGLQFDCWREANAQVMDYLIAVTNNDAVNALASAIADKFGIARKIARVRSLELFDQHTMLNARDMKIDLIIHPEELTAQEIVRLIKIRSGNVIIDIAEGQMEVLSTRVHEDAPWAHKILREISQIHSEFPFRIVSIARGIKTMMPGGDHEILPGDQVFILANSRNLPSLMELTGIDRHRHQKVMILGGGLIGSRVAQLLEDSFEVTLIEKEADRAEELSASLSHAEVLHGDGSFADTLVQAGILDMDTIITATNDNETNIMSCLLAKHVIDTQQTHLSGPLSKTIALVDKEQYLVLAATMGADIVLSKKVLAGNEILKFIRRGHLLSVSHMHGIDAEVIELVAGEGSMITKKPLYKLASLKDKMVIGGVFQDGKWQIAVGNTHIRPSDRVITVCQSQHLKDLQMMFF